MSKVKDLAHAPEFRSSVQRAAALVQRGELEVQRLVIAAREHRIECRDDLGRRHAVVDTARARAQQGRNGMAPEGVQSTTALRSDLHQRLAGEGVVEDGAEQRVRRVRSWPRIKVMALLPVPGRSPRAPAEVGAAEQMCS